MTPQENVSFRLKNIMPAAKKLWEQHLVPLEKLFFLRKQKFASEFFCTWHNVSSQKEHTYIPISQCDANLKVIFKKGSAVKYKNFRAYFVPCESENDLKKHYLHQKNPIFDQESTWSALAK